MFPGCPGLAVQPEISLTEVPSDHIPHECNPQLAEGMLCLCHGVTFSVPPQTSGCLFVLMFLVDQCSLCVPNSDSKTSTLLTVTRASSTDLLLSLHPAPFQRELRQETLL